jgi:hypothetical protein
MSICFATDKGEEVRYKSHRTRKKQGVRFVNRTGVVLVFIDLLGILDSHPHKEHRLVFPRSFDLVIEL